MKETKNTPSLDELLSSVEHAGRDARRRQQLAGMIEQMAANEAATRRAKTRRLTLRMLAAACLAGIVITAAHFLAPAAEHSAPLLAKTETVPATEPALPTDSLQPVAAQPGSSNSPAMSRPQTRKVTPIDNGEPLLAQEHIPELPVAEPEKIEAIVEPAPAMPIEEPLYAEATAPAEVGTAAAAEQPSATVATTEETSVAMNTSDHREAPATQRRSLFRMRQSEPSLMTGTTLSFRII